MRSRPQVAENLCSRRYFRIAIVPGVLRRRLLPLRHPTSTASDAVPEPSGEYRPATLEAMDVARETARPVPARPPGALARPPLAWPGRHRAGHAGDGQPPARPAPDDRSGPGPRPRRAGCSATDEDDWAKLTYEQRKFFEWGGWLAVRPIEELPYYRVLMDRERADSWGSWIQSEHGAAVEEMQTTAARPGRLANRHFSVAERIRVDSYRGRKDSSIALHFLWRIGEAMVTRRTPTFERVYAADLGRRPGAFLRRSGRRGGRLPAAQGMVRSAGFSKFSRPCAGTSSARSRTAEIAAWRDAKLADGVARRSSTSRGSGPPRSPWRRRCRCSRPSSAAGCLRGLARRSRRRRPTR